MGKKGGNVKVKNKTTSRSARQAATAKKERRSRNKQRERQQKANEKRLRHKLRVQREAQAGTDGNSDGERVVDASREDVQFAHESAAYLRTTLDSEDTSAVLSKQATSKKRKRLHKQAMKKQRELARMEEDNDEDEDERILAGIRAEIEANAELEAQRRGVPKAKKAKLEGDEEDDDDEEEEEDVEMVASDSSEEDSAEDITARYEQQPRSANYWEKKNGKTRTLLPTKGIDGSVQAPTKVVRAVDEDGDEEMEGSDADSEEQDSEEEEEEPQQPAISALDADELRRKRLARIQRIKQSVALLCEKILENPERHLGKVTELHQLAMDRDLTVQQLVLLSEVEVLRDVMPGYRIRLPTEQERKMIVSKEVAALRRHEALLLSSYHRLLTMLIEQAKKYFRGRHKKQRQLGSEEQRARQRHAAVIARCLCRLLESCFEFNHRKELIAATVPLLNANMENVRDMALHSVSRMFKDDTAGDATLEAVKIVAHMAKKQGGRLKPEMLQCFLSLRLSLDVLKNGGGGSSSSTASAAAAAANPTGAAAQSRKMKQKRKRQLVKLGVDPRDLERDLNEHRAEVSVEHRQRAQTAILTQVFTTYFRILKHQLHSPCLSVVLRGLAKFSHLVNLELVLDLLEYLKRLSATKLPLESSVNSIIAAFQTLRAHGSAISIDMKEYYVLLYSLLWEFTHPHNHALVPSLLRCLELMFIASKQLSVERVASFVKRLCCIAPHLPPHGALGIMHEVRKMMSKYSRVRQLLDGESVASGSFLATGTDPDMSNVFATTMWDLCIEQHLYHPFASGYAENLVTGQAAAASLLRLHATTLYEHYDSSEAIFNPPIRAPTTASKSGWKKLRVKRLQTYDSELQHPSAFVQHLDTLSQLPGQLRKQREEQ